jgi:hypothetical protein
VVKTYSERLEIAFWSWVIPLMRQSNLVQALLPAVLRLLQYRESLKRRVLFLACAWAGLGLGLVLGFLRARIG